jgi:hypothetical protein
MTFQPSRRVLLRSALLLAALLLSVLAGYATAGSDRDPAASAPQAATAPVLRGVVRAAINDRLTLATEGGSNLELALSDATRTEALRRIERGAIRPGQWVNVGASANNANVFTLLGLVVVPDVDPMTR